MPTKPSGPAVIFYSFAVQKVPCLAGFGFGPSLPSPSLTYPNLCHPSSSNEAESPVPLARCLCRESDGEYGEGSGCLDPLTKGLSTSARTNLGACGGLELSSHGLPTKRWRRKMEESRPKF